MNKLDKYSETSTLMDIQIRYNSEKFKFNLFDEVKVKESQITSELMEQPTKYGFLTLLHTHLIKLHGDKELSVNRAFAKAYVKYKKEINKDTGRPNSDDVAKAKAEIEPEHVRLQDELLQTKFDMGRINACVRAFEQRKDILQTLSANRRKEREL